MAHDNRTKPVIRYFNEETVCDKIVLNGYRYTKNNFIRYLIAANCFQSGEFMIIAKDMSAGDFDFRYLLI